MSKNQQVDKRSTHVHDVMKNLRKIVGAPEQYALLRSMILPSQSKESVVGEGLPPELTELLDELRKTPLPSDFALTDPNEFKREVQLAKHSTLLIAIAGAESGGGNFGIASSLRGSSAWGAWQIIDATWDGAITNHKNLKDIPKAIIRTDPDNGATPSQEVRVADSLADDAIKYLKGKLNRWPTGLDVYAIWFLGHGLGLALISAPNNAQLWDFLTETGKEQNPWAENLSVKQWRANARTKMGSAADTKFTTRGIKPRPRPKPKPKPKKPKEQSTSGATNITSSLINGVWVELNNATMKAFNKFIKTQGAFVVTSSTRTIAHNEEVGGTADSEHLNGKALDIDFRPTGTRKEKLAKRERFIGNAQRAGFTGFGLATNYMHIDTGTPRWWTYDNNGNNINSTSEPENKFSTVWDDRVPEGFRDPATGQIPNYA